MDSAANPLESFRLRVELSRDKRARARTLVRKGQWRDAEPDRVRAAAYTRRMAAAKVAPGAEAIQGESDDLQPAVFLAEGAVVRRAVAFVEVNDPRGTTSGTGFLISPSLFLTNQHVIHDVQAARSALITFDREVRESGGLLSTTTFQLAPDALALFSPEDELDYALIAVGERLSGSTALADFGYCPLLNAPNRHRVGMNVNIIQHPQGQPKMIAVRNNILTSRTPRTLLYETDTEAGSSGSPVFNDAWDVVALHHYGRPFLEVQDEQGNPVPVTVNEGIRISCIYEDLVRQRDTLSSTANGLLTRALGLGMESPAANKGRRLSPARPTGDARLPREDYGDTTHPQSLLPPLCSLGNAAMSTPQEFRFIIPLEVTVRVGALADVARADASTANSAPTERRLQRGPESARVDKDYGSREGYKRDHIEGYDVPLPEPVKARAAHVAPLRATEPDAERGKLRYQHFSIKMDKTKRMAMFTATNIDGATYLKVDRETGDVVDGPEGDRWFNDPRISEAFWTGQSFYSEWSTYFDRGHLTRRTDPLWGDAASAARANADTFHWTNCSPQHFRFNQSARFWQGAERYVLENGVLSHDERKRISVFQGPIFDATVDLYADELQIPSSFFKVIVWAGEHGLKSVGLIVDQLSLLGESRKYIGRPKDLPEVDVQQWRVPIQQIEARTSLSFGDAIRSADTISSAVQPSVGEESSRGLLLRSMADILR